VKHLFFQPCDNELLVVVHIHLKSPIMIGKKKAHVSNALHDGVKELAFIIAAQDIQFIREASDVQFDETGNRKRKHRYGDEDEIEMEQQERKRRLTLNREFKNFAEKIAEAVSASVSVLQRTHCSYLIQETLDRRTARTGYPFPGAFLRRGSFPDQRPATTDDRLSCSSH
jgi:nucleosome binding factor SPN SPT16 subunit